MNPLDAFHSKISGNLEMAEKTVSIWKKNKEKIVFTNGCFDIFHAGHAYALTEAAKYGTKLIVGLNDDLSVKSLKGNHRPFHTLPSRAYVLAALSVVDLIIPFSELNPEKLIHAILPDVLVKGNDYAPENIAGADIVIENKGEVILIPLIPDVSTTKIASLLFEKMNTHGN
jgi:D-beta-D-heptose 7-phosphate kinase/D-beta-D-heptose 1-phosphate adenosyltransferase